MRGAVEGPGGNPRARQRSSRGPERGANGPHAGLLWVLSFLPHWKEAVGLCGSSCLTCVCVFQSDLSTPIRVSLIVVSDNKRNKNPFRPCLDHFANNFWKRILLFEVLNKIYLQNFLHIWIVNCETNLMSLLNPWFCNSDATVTIN